MNGCRVQIAMALHTAFLFWDLAIGINKVVVINK